MPKKKGHQSLLSAGEQATLMSGIWDAILAIGNNLQPLFYNSRFVLLYGAEALNEKHDLHEMFSSEDIQQAYLLALQNGEKATITANPFSTSESTNKFFSITVSPLRKEGNQISGAVGIFHDISELKRAEKMRIDFVANVSHELRTPLTSIKGYTDTLLADIKNPLQFNQESAENFLEIISRNTHRLLNLINDLLDLSAIESNAAINRSNISTSELTKKIIQQLKGNFDIRKHSIQEHYDTDVVFCDSQRVEQVLVNLLDNACKYTPNEGNISIHWTRVENSVRLKISDSGPGIPPQHLDRLFERFYRVDRGRSRDVGGTGLGLAIVKHIVQRHNGNVWAESAVGKGTSIFCEFPNV